MTIADCVILTVDVALCAIAAFVVLGLLALLLSALRDLLLGAPTPAAPPVSPPTEAEAPPAPEGLSLSERTFVIDGEELHVVVDLAGDEPDERLLAAFAWRQAARTCTAARGLGVLVHVAGERYHWVTPDDPQWSVLMED